MSEATVDAHDPRPASNESSLAAIVYALFIAGLFLGFIPSLIGVIIAHAAANSRDDLMRSHFKYQIRTFWIGFAIFAISVIALGFGLGKMIETGLKTVDSSVQVTEITTPDNSTDMDVGTQMEDAVERAMANLQMGNLNLNVEVETEETEDGATVSIRFNDKSTKITSVEGQATDPAQDAAAVVEHSEMQSDGTTTTRKYVVKAKNPDVNWEDEKEAWAFFTQVAPPFGLGMVGFALAFLFVLIRSIIGLVRLARRDAV